MLSALAGTAVLGAVAIGVTDRDAGRPDPGPSATPSPGASQPAAPSRSVPSPVDRVEALHRLLRAREQAVSAGDEEAWLATVDPQATAFRVRQQAVFRNLRALPLESWTYRQAGQAPPLSEQRLAELGAAAWVARVWQSHRFAGFDGADAAAEQYLTLVERDGQWLLASDTDGGTVRQVWDLGPLRVERGERSLAVGTADADVLQRYAREADAAVDRVSAVWGTQWGRRVVLLVPGSQNEMAELLQRDSAAGLDQIAAVTTGELGDDGPAGSDRVLVNPAGMARLGALGRRVVLAHETTHVAVRSSTVAPVPIWLSECYADHVGYRDVDLPRTRVAADVLALVRRGAGPRSLPTEGDFDPTRTTIAPSYSGAWLACELIADRYGEQRLTALYVAAAGGRSAPGAAGQGEERPDADAALARAMRSVLGTDVRTFTAQWRAYLESLATP